MNYFLILIAITSMLYVLKLLIGIYVAPQTLISSPK